MKPTDPTIAALIDAGNALRKAAQGSAQSSYLHGCDYGRTGCETSRDGARDIAEFLGFSIAAWNKAARAARKG